MVRAVVQRDLAVHDRVARDHAVFHLFLHALVDGRDIFARYDTADNRVLEFVARAGLRRFDSQVDMAILAATA